MLPGLRDAWARLLGSQPEIGEELLVRWSEPHRVYHGLRHLAQALEAAELAAGGTPSRSVRLALWFHDAVYDFHPGQDEEASARLAEALLGTTELPPEETAEVARLVRLTSDHVLKSPEDAAGAILLDADLSILGQPRERYAGYVREIRREHREVPEADFRQRRVAVLDGLLALDPLFATPAGKAAWGVNALTNLTWERDSWLRI